MHRTSRSRMIVGLSLACCFSGCTWPEIVDSMNWQKQYRQSFTALNPEDESVAQIDIATMVWRRDQPMLNEGLWAELDEQFLPLDQRQALAQHGLRIGLMRSATGSRLQAAIANPEYAKEVQQASTEVVREQTIVQDRMIDVPKLAPVCTVEARRMLNRSEVELVWPVGRPGGKAKLLVPDAEKDYVARNVSQLEMQFAIMLQKLPDGMTKIRLVPMVKCALATESNTNVFMESLRLRNTVSKLEQRYEKLAVEATLSQNEYLVISTTRSDVPALPGEAGVETWGDLAFMSYPTDQQTVLVFRGTSVISNRSPDAPKKGNAWPLAWQTKELGSAKQ
ncbi:MAG: hypothetical protein QM703_02500 [Gemmatales bacterium]